MPPTDYDDLSDGSELTGDEQPEQEPEMEDDEQVSVTRTPSKNRKRIVEDDEEERDDDEEVVDALGEDDGEMDDDDDDDQQDLDADADADAEGEELDHMDEDEAADADPDEAAGEDSDDDDDEFRDELAEDEEAPPAKSKPRSRAAAAKRAATAVSAAASSRAVTPTKKKGSPLKVTLRRSPSSARKAASTPISKGGKAVTASASSSAKAKGGLKATPAASAKKPKNISKIKWKARPSRGAKDDDNGGGDDDDDVDLGAEGSVSPSLSALEAGEDGEPMSGTDDGIDELDVSGRGTKQGSPMVAKTARQLARENKDLEAGLLELPMTDESKKRKLTETELALRRSETARKRKNQTEKKLEDDKVETINRLLKKQVGRSRNKLPQTSSTGGTGGSGGGDSDGGDDDDGATVRGDETLTRKAQKELPAPLFRYVNGPNGSLLGVPSGPLNVVDVYPSYAVATHRALLIEELDALPPASSDSTLAGKTEAEQRLREKRRARLQAARKDLDEEETLEQVWGPEGLYEFRLRRSFGLGRKAWIGDRPRPVEDVQEDVETAEAEAEAEAGAGAEAGAEAETKEPVEQQQQQVRSEAEAKATEADNVETTGS